MDVAGRFQLSKRSEGSDRAVRLLARVAANSVPYYRDLFSRSDLKPDSIDSVESLRSLPVTPRGRIAELPCQSYLREGVNKKHLSWNRTSGSTGAPLTVYLSRAEYYYRLLLLARAVRARFPHCLPTRIADVGRIASRRKPLLTQRMGPVLLTRVPGNVPISEQVELYVGSRPQLVEGYASSLALLAQELSERMKYPRPRWVISRGEVLSDETRRLIAEVFECPVADFYNSEEVGNMAWECRDRPGILHVNTDACVLELLDDQGAPIPHGVEGRVVVTNLYNQTMPFIRYDIGDHATWDNQSSHTCSCGAATPTLSSVEGRTDDYILLPDLRRVSPRVVQQSVNRGTTSVTLSGGREPHALQFQVLQEEIGTADVRIVPRGVLPERLEESLAVEFHKLHPEFSVRLSVVEDIPTESSGKPKRIISRVPQQSEIHPADLTP